MVSGVCEVAPSTPNPPARLTAATTSRQWLKASSGNSIPSMSQIGDFMVVSLPAAAFGAAHTLFEFLRILETTLAHRGRSCQAPPTSSLRNGFAVVAGGAASSPRLEGCATGGLMVRDGAPDSASALPGERLLTMRNGHSVPQNMQLTTLVLALALSRRG